MKILSSARRVPCAGLRPLIFGFPPPCAAAPALSGQIEMIVAGEAGGFERRNPGIFFSARASGEVGGGNANFPSSGGYRRIAPPAIQPPFHAP